ncbi:MAG TPA: hypothetical protein VI409_03860 [Gaiellaceae bacterium]|nr:hypothetical protein [Gaiellaceae bacterium]
MRKLRRGVKQAEVLRGEVLAFEKSDAYVLKTEREPRGPQEVKYICHAIRQRDAPMDWPLAIGDTIYNLRCALDHVVYAKWRSRKAMFPIYVDKCEFQVRGTPRIAGLSPTLRADIESVQPYRTIPEQPDLDPLAVLHELSNLDKHRELSTVSNFLDVPWVASSVPPTTQFSFEYTGEGKPMNEETHVLTFVLIGPEANSVHVHPDFSFEVRVEGRGLRDVLEQITRRVGLIVQQMDAGLRLPALSRPVHDQDP